MPQTEELKKKTQEKTDQAEHAVEQQVDKVEHSKVGSKIPTKIQNVDFKDIIYATLVMIMFSTIPIYLFVSMEIVASTTKMAWIYTFMEWCLLICGIGAVLFDALVIAMKQKMLFKLTLLFKVVKIAVTLISILVVKMAGNFARALYIIYALSTIGLDFIFIYYATLFFGRLSSDKFDEDANPKTGDANAQV